MKKLVYLFLILFLFVSCQTNKVKNRSISIQWELKSNLSNSNNDAEWQMTLINSSEIDLPAKGWTLYYNVIQTQQIPETYPLVAEHANGDLRSIKPTKDFHGLSSGDSIMFPLFSNGSVLNISDRPLGFYIVFDNEPEKAYSCEANYIKLPLTGLIRPNGDILPVHSAKITFNENKDITLLDKEDICPIIPTPAIYKPQKEEILLKESISISGDFKNAVEFLKKKLEVYYSGTIEITSDKGKIRFEKTNEIANPEGYELNISTNGINIKASSEAGAFYGVQSLLQLLPNNVYAKNQDEITLPGVFIKDEPRFKYRGQFLDVARNFHSKKQVLKLLDLMAFYKLNKFHFHICDDEGWRVEIADLPELTEYGAFRGYSVNESKYLQPSFASGPTTKSNGSGYYSREDFIEILQYATERHIEVIPEIDMPGHARAAIKSMEKRYEKFMAQGDTIKATEYLLTDFNDKSEYTSVQGWHDNVVNVGMESTYRFLEKVTDEMIALFKQAGAPLSTIHTGGDEVPNGVWEQSPECERTIAKNKKYNSHSELSLYFIERFTGILSERNLMAAGWEEIALLHGNEIKPNQAMVGKNLVPFVWNNTWNSGAEDIGYQLANAGYPIVLAHVTNFYFDLAYHKHPQEFGYYWGNFINTRKPWEYTPFDLTKCAETDHFGNVVEAQKLKNEMIKLSPEGAANVMGIQGLLWSETSLGWERNDYQIFPKLLGLAERAWSPQPEWALKNDKTMRENNWNNFVNTIGQFHLPKLDHLHGGINYRIPAVGAKVINDTLHANLRFPGIDIRYTTNGDEPTIESELYTKPFKVNGTIKLSAFAKNGRKGRGVEITN